jgi:hypothetical protein
MTSSQIRYYRNNVNAVYEQPCDFFEIIHSISPLTRVGALCFIFGKFMGILALPAAFIPSLNMFVVPLVIIWGSMVFTAIGLCSIDHYRKKKNEPELQTTKDTHEQQESKPLPLYEEEAVIIPLSVSQI